MNRRWAILMITGFAAALFRSGAAELSADAFLAECAARAIAAEKAGGVTVLGRDGWMFFAPELRHLGAGAFWGEAAGKVSRATKPEQADPLPAILDFKTQLDQAGIELLLVPVPPKAVIYPDTLDGKAPVGQRLDPHHQAFYAELKRHGVAVVDLVPEFLSARATNQLFCKQDTHWSGAACVLVAKLLAKELQTRPWFGGVSKQSFASESQTVEITGDLAKDSGAKTPAKESVALRVVGTKEGAEFKPVEPSRDSPVILLGDSHNLVFHAGDDMHARGAGLPDQLALEFGFPVDLVAVRGSGATPARVNLLRRARTEGYLAKKKVVIWCFGAREFTEASGWQKVPVVK